MHFGIIGRGVLIEAMNVAKLISLNSPWLVAGTAMGIFKEGSVAREDAILVLSKEGIDARA